jgi:hypothetical protein
MINSKGKKVTMATIKSFVKRERAIDNLYIKCKDSFDGMVDCVMPCKDQGMSKVTQSNLQEAHTLGIAGAWFVGSSRDYFTPFADDDFIGYEVYNCCGSFILAMRRIA